MPAPLVLTTGVFRSGSTWIFNAVRLLASLAGNRVRSGFREDLCEEEIGGRNEACITVLKAHNPSKRLLEMIAASGGRTILTVRDPRDCVCSFMAAFRRDFPWALRRVTASCDGALKAVEFSRPHTFRYEAGFMDDRATLADVSDYIGIPNVMSNIDCVFSELKRESVRSKIASLTNEGVIDQSIPRTHDPVSHWHPNHIGDGKIGKYQHLLTDEQTRIVEDRNRAFLDMFGYDRPGRSGH